MNPRAFAAVASSAVALSFTIVSELRASSADDEIAEAQRLTSKGAFEDSVAHWKKAATSFEQAKNSSGQVEAQIQLAAAYYALGQTNLATETLIRAQELASGDQRHLAQIKAALGAIYTLAAPAMEDHS